MFKKIILAALIVTSAAFADFFNVGARAAANFGTAWGDDAKDAKWGVGFNAGVALKIDILPVITIIPGLEVDYRRVGEEENYSDGTLYEYVTDETLGMWYLDIPVLARVKLIPMVYLEGGVAFSFNLSATMDYDETETKPNGETEKESGDMSYSKFVNTMDIGLIVGAGVSLLDKLDVDFRLVLGLNSYTDKDEVGVSMKHLRMQAGVIYWF